MVTHKGKKSSKPKQHVVVRSKKGAKFCGTFEKGKLKVTEERTAPGQNLGVGMLDIKEKKWSEHTSVPAEVKRDFEIAVYGKTQ